MSSFESRIIGLRNRVLSTFDLFSGCGGFGLGIRAAGFQNTAALEIDNQAIKTHALNFHASMKLHAQPMDITQTEPENFAIQHGLDNVDMIIGGPPCQAYARIGRAKLRDVSGNPEAYKLDPRGNLYLKYLEWISFFKPLALIMENVPDALNVGGVNVMYETAYALSEMGYIARYAMLNAAHYGVPQTRERAFLIAVRKEFGFIPHMPKPTHGITLGSGYNAIRANALKGKLQNDPYYISVYRPSTGEEGYEKFISTEEALSDLPIISPSSGIKSLETKVSYLSEPRNEYQMLMRNWLRQEPDNHVTAHVTRYLPRDCETFKRMPYGSEYPEAHKIALEIFHHKAIDMGIDETNNSDEFFILKRSIVPPYSTEKFSSKWWKMNPNMPSKTLLAHLGKDGYSHIHYDSDQGRSISVREAARLQGFPDGFIFNCAMGSAFKQIGNAVPTLVAHAIGKQLYNDMVVSI